MQSCEWQDSSEVSSSLQTSFKCAKCFIAIFFSCWFICILDLGESKSPPPKKSWRRERKSLTDRQIALLERREEGDGKMFFDQLISISVFFPVAKPSGLRKVGVVMGGLVLLRYNFFYWAILPSSHSYFSSGWDLALFDQISLRGRIHCFLTRFFFGVESVAS